MELAVIEYGDHDIVTPSHRFLGDFAPQLFAAAPFRRIDCYDKDFQSAPLFVIGPMFCLFASSADQIERSIGHESNPWGKVGMSGIPRQNLPKVTLALQPA